MKNEKKPKHLMKGFPIIPKNATRDNLIWELSR
jgi:hypothetical protein